MAGRVKIYICLVVLSLIGQAFLLEEVLNLDEKFLEENVVELITNRRVKEPKNTSTNDGTKSEKPVNEQYPYAVLYGGSCGGTIISPTWILTAARCTIISFDSMVIAGTNNIDNDSGITVRVKRRVIHPLFIVGPYWLDARQYNIEQIRAQFDFLLVELEEPLPLDGITMKAAKLNSNYYLAPRTKVSFASYGADNYEEFITDVMQVKKFELLSVKECAIVKGYNPIDMICARGTPPDFNFACRGDYGSGLVDENGVLVGVTSWSQDSPRECHKGAIVYFSNVALVQKWIRNVTNLELYT